MPNIGKLSEGNYKPGKAPKLGEKFQAFPTPKGNVSGEDEQTQQSAPQPSGKGTVGSADEEPGKKDEGAATQMQQTEIGSVGSEEEGEIDEESSDQDYSQMSRNAQINAYNHNAQIAADAQKKTIHLHEKTKYTLGDLICVILAVIKDIIEAIGAIFLGLGVILGAIISFVVTVLLFIIRIYKGHAVNRALIRSTLLWLSDVVTFVIPVYTVIMIIQIHNDVKEAKIAEEENNKTILQAEKTMAELAGMIRSTD